MTWSLHLGDCLAYLATLPDKSVDHVITDPPYSEEFHGKARSQGRDGFVRVADYGFAGLTDEMRITLAESFARLARRWVVVFSDPESSREWRTALKSSGMRYCRKGIWVKLACVPQMTGDRPASGHEEISCAYANCPGRTRWSAGGKRGVWTWPVVSASHDGREHPTVKPLSLMQDLVEDFTDPGETILDPFAGSGTTGVACLRLGRHFIGCEVDPKYHALATERLRAEESGTTLHAYRAGQIAMFGK